MHALLALFALFPLTGTAGPPHRTAVSLDGTWQIAEGGMDVPPERFTASVQVPGLADMAIPAFAEVGERSARRRAFWYRRTFTVAGPRRPVALLKVNKAQFGTKVWLNGAPVGEHPGCSTPGQFDVGGALRYGSPNALVVRVGADRDALAPTVPVNTDGEQRRWIPGIYDSVSLTLTSTPFVSSVQVAPHVASGTATVQVTIRHTGGVAAWQDVSVLVREWRSGRSAAPAVRVRAFVRPGETAVLTRTVKLRRPRLWSPEDPFLYVARCTVGADAAESRFGMREFRYDRATGRAMLNGRPYFLRGTNFCMYRFFEDPQRGGLPWDRAWVRKLLSMPRTALHWNAARVCIAPFPEFWYDLADELGWLLQDEFPIWGFRKEWSQDELVAEFRDWLSERWNHPSIVVWDACNETLEPRTGQAITAVRALDLSGRPWDDGYSAPNRPGDAVEDHPYRFINPGFRLEDLGSALDRQGGLRAPPVVINEYDWLWLNRDGTPTTLTQGLYTARLGPNATPAERREFCAYNSAALTEYWRARRQAAGVEHFCYLTYSRPGGQTSDNFLDLRRLTLEPRYLAYMRDAFAPLGVMIDDFAEEVAPGVPHAYRVLVTNDLYRAQAGGVTLRIVPDGPPAGPSAAVWQGRPVPFRVAALGQAVLTLPATLPAAPGRYVVVAEMRVAGGAPVCSRRKFRVVSAEEARGLVNLAVGRPVRASSAVHDQRGDFPARLAVDGKGGTRWSSEFSDPQWLEVDLGSSHEFGRARLVWEAAYGKAYRIEVSDDGATWRPVYTTASGSGGREDVRFTPVKARYVRMVGTERGTPFGYSLWEFGVYER